MQRTICLAASVSPTSGSTTICPQKSQYLATASGSSLLRMPEMVATSPSRQLVFPENCAAAATISLDRSSPAWEGAREAGQRNGCCENQFAHDASEPDRHSVAAIHRTFAR
ncbi:hypothetical protein, partial [Mesorhizobium sp. M7D.F.Ca.US.004.01.2.1]|uniref:hypothetical protein n=1 Tax=Mesorhizobium sp. M7D.F.Ca.US.004.01.2.1 TaxID=2496738 RepID=UPI0019D309E4